MKNLIKWKMIIIFIIVFIISTVKVFGTEGNRELSIIINPIVNPASSYCAKMGYESFVERTEKGEIGMCRFPDGSSADEWKFLGGTAGENWSYCNQKGYELKTLSNDSRCFSALNPDCSICVLSNGTEVEATLLMKSEGFVAKKCGNGICEVGESNDNCPQDCPKTGFDNTSIIYIVSFSIIVIIIVLYIIMRRRNKVEYVYKR